MRDNKNRFKHESLQDANTIRDLLKAVTRGIAKGKLHFSDEDDEIVLEPEGLLHLKLTASQDENRNRLSIRISWHSEDSGEKLRKELSIK
jgi:amphi-Trp domain-containing protein